MDETAEASILIPVAWEYLSLDYALRLTKRMQAIRKVTSIPGLSCLEVS